MLPLEGGSEFISQANSSFEGKIVSNQAFIEPITTKMEPPEFSTIQESSLLGFAPPITVTSQVLGTILGSSASNIDRDIIEYEVKEGDTLSDISQEHDVSVNTLLWANNMSSRSTLKIGKKLVILPTTGVLHHVKLGDTISVIAVRYKAKSEDVVAFNNLVSEDDIFVGDMIIVPGGIMPAIQVSNSTYTQVPLASSYFICPITAPCRVTQKLHFYNAIDFSRGKCGDSIYAAAGGVVQRIKYGWNGGAGNTITILHPNGAVTSYGHIQTFLANQGDQVNQGQTIALMGGQPGTAGAGKSTGCHVHFSVQGAANPFR
ncbi:LysM peptidoglycan-binding domain-containing protein [Patescibacteria group bacterium]